MEAHIVDGQVTALILHLSGHDNGLAVGYRISDHIEETATFVRGETAYSVAFNNDSIVVLQQVREHTVICTGNHFHETDLGVQASVELGGREAHSFAVFQEKAVLHHRQKGVVDAGKGGETGGVGLSCTGA